MSLNIDLAMLEELSREHNVVSVIDTVELQSETPLSIFEKLAAKRTGSFLLESAEQGVWARYSFIGVHNRGTLSFDGSHTTWFSAAGASALPQADLPTGHVLDQLDALVSAWSSPEIQELPPLTSGLVGLIGWDMIRELERLPNKPKSDFSAPVLAFAMFRDLVVVDHQESKMLLVSNVFVTSDSDLSNDFDAALARIADMRQELHEQTLKVAGDFDLTGQLQPKLRTEKSNFLAAIEKAKHFVRIGDVFQVVLAQRFDVELNASPLEVYRALRAFNPSPYMYLLNFEDSNGNYAVVGSSPEALVKLQQGRAITHPIAGSRPRGASTAVDKQNEADLLADAKERAEHLMLVDLARNDLLKVCEPASVNVTEFMQVHRFSHIMHLVSTVEGQVAADKSVVDVFRATFPAGTLSGAPKPRALEIIDELEESNRGVYGGVVGYFDFAGNADLAIAIRTAFLRDGVAYIEAGAGLVLDSVPETEYQETVSKASAPMRAVSAANLASR